MFKKICNKLLEILKSKRMLALYWSSGAMLFAGFSDIVMQQLTNWDAHNMITVFAGLVFAQITKKLNSKK